MRSKRRVGVECVQSVDLVYDVGRGVIVDIYGFFYGCGRGVGGLFGGLYQVEFIFILILGWGAVICGFCYRQVAVL